MYSKSSLGSNALEGVALNKGVNTLLDRRTSVLLPGFIKYARYELSLSPQTATKYEESIKSAIRDIGDLPIDVITPAHFTDLKEKIFIRGAGEARIRSIVYAFKSLLSYCRNFLGIHALDPKLIKPPKHFRREVIFLTNEEIQQFLDSIKIYKKWEGKKKVESVLLSGLRFRALVETLLGTGMRISEALSLNRDSVNLEKCEAKIIGKGNKERVVFFTKRSLEWIRFYLSERKDEAKPLFVTQRLNRMARCDVSSLFKRQTKNLGINKKITPHILRHTVATNLLFNGCPISHVKEILGHERLETTCKYYLGVDKRKAKEAHGQFLSF